MKKLLLFLAIVMSLLSASAQDVIVKNDGSTVLCKVIGVNDTEVIYTKWSDSNGPQYIMDRTLVANINYMDGRTEKYNEQVSNAYAPGIQQTGASNFNDNALLALDMSRNNDYLKKAKQLKALGWGIGLPLILAGGGMLVPGIIIACDSYSYPEDFLGLVIPGAVALAGGITTLTFCLVKSNQYLKKSKLLACTPLFQHQFNFNNGSSLCAGIDMIRDMRFKQTTLGLGLQYNF